MRPLPPSFLPPGIILASLIIRGCGRDLNGREEREDKKEYKRGEAKRIDNSKTLFQNIQVQKIFVKGAIFKFQRESLSTFRLCGHGGGAEMSGEGRGGGKRSRKWRKGDCKS